MHDYRAYILGGEVHRFTRVEGFSHNHSDDAAALREATGLSDKLDVEVWDGGRLVALLSPGGKAMSPELAPSIVCAAPLVEGKAATANGPLSLSRVSEMVLAASSK